MIVLFPDHCLSIYLVVSLNLQNAINVILSPPPDLKPIYLQVGESYTTGDSVYITWEVENDGDAPYKHTWFDRVVS